MTESEVEVNELPADLVEEDSSAEKEETSPEKEEMASEVATAPESEQSNASDEETDEEEEEAPTIPKLDPERAALPWYVVNTHSGYELQAKKSLEERIRLRGLEKKFGNVLVPQETVVELVRGKKKTSTRKFFPGYMIAQIAMDDETWHLVKDTPKVSGFIGNSRNPSPITEAEVNALTQQMEGAQSRPRPRVHFEEGDAVKVIDGPFAEFNGTVDEVKPDKGKLRVLISIFGRNTPVELDFVQVEKA